MALLKAFAQCTRATTALEYAMVASVSLVALVGILELVDVYLDDEIARLEVLLAQVPAAEASIDAKLAEARDVTVSAGLTQ